MRKVNERVQSAIKSLSTNSNFDILLEWLTSCLDNRLRESCKKENDVESRWLQGEARAFNYIIEEIKRAKTEIL
jgi:hypothetical protein